MLLPQPSPPPLKKKVKVLNLLTHYDIHTEILKFLCEPGLEPCVFLVALL